MDWEKLIREAENKHQVKSLASFVLAHPEEINSLMNVYSHSKYRITQRASWILSHIADERADLLTPFLPNMVDQIKETNSQAVKRNTIRIFQLMKIPESLEGEVVEICFSFLKNPNEAVAIRVFSMTVLYNISVSYPELLNELTYIIEEHMPYGSAGFKSRGKKILKAIRKK